MIVNDLLKVRNRALVLRNQACLLRYRAVLSLTCMLSGCGCECEQSAEDEK